MISLDQIATLKRYVALIPEEPRNEPVEAVNPALAELFCEFTHVLHPLPDTLTEADAVQFLDKHLLP